MLVEPYPKRVLVLEVSFGGIEDDLGRAEPLALPL